MSLSYRAVGWNRQKLMYDAVILAGIGLYLAAFFWITPRLDPNADAMNIRIRAYGSAAFILLTVILSIGPLSRLDRRFLPLLYNRRHMGVATCLLALQHARVTLTWYHDYGDLDPMVSLLVGNTRYDLAKAASRLGVSEAELRRDLEAELRRLGVSAPPAP